MATTPPDATFNPKARQEDYAEIYQQVLDEVQSESRKSGRRRRKLDNKIHHWRHYYERPKWKDFEPDSRLADKISQAPPPPPRRFKNATPGYVVIKLLREAHARGAIPEIRANFNETRDSGGHKWSKRPEDLVNHKFEPKSTLLEVVRWLAESNHAEARMNGRILELYKPDTGQDHPDVLLAKGRNLIDGPSNGTHRDRATSVFVESESGVHGWVNDHKLRRQVGRRVEAAVDVGYMREWEKVEQRGRRYLHRFGPASHARTFSVIPDKGANPYKDYQIGDTIRLMDANHPTKHRVRQIGLRWETDNSCIITVVLSDKIVPYQVKQHRRQRAVNGKTAMTTPSLTQLSRRPPGSDGEAPDIPSAPKVSVKAGTAEIQWDGKTEEGLNPVWDQSHVEMHIGLEENFDPTDITLWHIFGGAGVTTVNFPDYDTPYYIKFIAVDTGGDRSGPSEEVIARVPKIQSDDIAQGAIGSNEIDPDLNIGSDGQIPGVAPQNVRAQGGNGFIMILWDAVVNADPVTYNVYGSDVQGFIAGPDNLLTPDGANSPKSFNRLADDTLMEYFVSDPITGDPTEEERLYYFRVEVRDADVPDGTIGPLSAEVSGSMDQTQEKDVAFGSITGQHFAGEVIYGGLIGNAAEGAGWRGTSEALGVYKSDGGAKFFAPTNDEPILANGQIIAQILDSYKMSVFGTDNAFMPGSKTYLRGTTQAPGTQPSVTSDNWKIQTLDTDEFKNNKRGFFYDAASDHYFFLVNGFGPDPVSSINEIDRNGAPINTVLMNTAAEGLGYFVYGITRDNVGRWYTLVRHHESAFYQIFRYDTTLSSLTAFELLNPGNPVDKRPTIGYDAVNNRLMIAYANPNNKTWRIEFRTCPGMLPTGTPVVSNMPYGKADLVAVLYGQHDLPDQDNFIVVNANAPNSPDDVKVFRTDGTDLPNRHWFIANNAHICGLTWDGSNFYHLSIPTGAANGHIVEYSDMQWTTESDDWYIKNTLWDSNALGTGLHETIASPARKINMTKRGGLHVTTGEIPASTGSNDDPTSVRVYVGRSDAGIPLDSQMFLAPTQPGVGETFVKIWNMDFAAADTLATKDPNFPEGDPAEWFDELAQKLLASDGSIGVFYTGDLKSTHRNVAGGGVIVDGGWVLADGSAVARVGIFARLFAEIGTQFGAGDGSTTFNLPDWRGRAPFGAGTKMPLNTNEGQPNETLRGFQHTHFIGHQHDINTAQNAQLTAPGTGGFHVVQTHTQQAGDTESGSGAGASNRMGAQGVNWLIKI